MRVLGHRRAPAVEHGGDADPGAKPLGIGGDRQGGFGRRGEQQTTLAPVGSPNAPFQRGLGPL